MPKRTLDLTHPTQGLCPPAHTDAPTRPSSGLSHLRPPFFYFLSFDPSFFSPSTPNASESQSASTFKIYPASDIILSPGSALVHHRGIITAMNPCWGGPLPSLPPTIANLHPLASALAAPLPRALWCSAFVPATKVSAMVARACVVWCLSLGLGASWRVSHLTSFLAGAQTQREAPS